MEGYLNEKFDLGAGDAFEVSEDEGSNEDAEVEKGKKKKQNGRGGLPEVEGDGDLKTIVQKYKKGLLNKRSVIKDVQTRLEQEECRTCTSLETAFSLCDFPC